MNQNTKTILFAAGIFGVVVLANMASEAMYTNSKIGIDKKTLLIAGGLGIGLTYLIITLKK